jgi:hypothetical protein
MNSLPTSPSGVTLPILPAPVLEPNRQPAISAPGLLFELPSNISGPAASASATIAEYTRQVSDGDHVVLTGADLYQATYPVYQNGEFLATTVTSQNHQRASVRLPRIGAAWDAALMWASTASGISEPVLLNTAVLLWAQEVIASGLTLNVYGRNLAHGNVARGASYLAVQPQAGGAVKLLTGTALDPYCAEFPTSYNSSEASYLAVGKYFGWPHNGHGGDFGWAERFEFEVVAANEHVRSYDFGQPLVTVQLSTNAADAANNVRAINLAFQQHKHFRTPDGEYPINGQIYPRNERKWSAQNETKLRAIGPWETQYLGMFGSNNWRMGMLENISFLDPNDIVPTQTRNGEYFANQSLIDLRRATGETGNEHIWLLNVSAERVRPYVEITNNNGQVIGVEDAQCLYVNDGRHYFVENCRITGTGTGFGNSQQVFITNYTHRLTNGADHTLYGLRVNGFSVKGLNFQDLKPYDNDGLKRGSGRGPKFGGQGGSIENTYIRDLNGRDLGPLFNDAPTDNDPHPYFDRNQGEACLREGNRTVWQNMVVSATATTITFADPVFSNPAAVPNGASPDDGLAVGVLPGYHLLWIGRGRGLDQMRGIVSVQGNTITLDKPLRVVPDASSFVQVGCFTRGNTIVNATLTGKRSIVDSDKFGIQCGINLYGGVHDDVVDGMHVTNMRHGFIYTPTTHADGQLDTVSFCQMRNSSFNGVRWGERYEAYGKEEELQWNFVCSGLRNILVSNVTVTNPVEARIVFKTPREAADIVAHWRADAPPIDGLVIENEPGESFLNDYRVPAGYGPTLPVAAGTLAGFVQAPKQALLTLTIPGVRL